ncbi:MAG: class I SAM-dependent methyltransferase [Deinococcota bacterium]|jgi:SAM-dependent methyltransferase|nr:class I SAM-dependent methyltransferase [Deinococcota bacterium]
MYRRVIADLRRAYDRSAEEREGSGLSAWKERERDEFLGYLHGEGKRTLLELGAGPGRDGRFFQERGLTVTCTDLSPEMVRLCRAKGLEAQVMDFLSLDFPAASFDAVYALNSLLHVPKETLPAVLGVVRTLLKPAGLFYMGVYGGQDFEGVWPEDPHDPKRFFAYYRDRGVLERLMVLFDLEYFRRVEVERGADFHFQSLIVRAPAAR